MAFEFFRKHEKLIIYSAGIFALLTFSITGSVLGFFDQFSATEAVRPKLTLPDGRVVDVTREDERYGVQLARATHLSQGFIGPAVLPQLDLEDVSDRQRVYAVLRRLAIEFGIEASLDEVDRAIEHTIAELERPQVETPGDLAAAFGFSSAGAYRNLVAEALRVGTLMRLLALGIDGSTSEAAKALTEDAELVTLEVAVFDIGGREEALAAAGVDEEVLRAYLEGLDEEEKSAYREPRNRVALRAVGLLREGFEPAAAGDLLADSELTEEQLRAHYDEIKEPRLRTGGSEDGLPAYRPFDEVIDELRTELQVRDAVEAIWMLVQADLADHVRAEVEAREAAQTALDEAMSAENRARTAAEVAPEDEAKQQELAEAQALAERRREELEQARAALDAKRAEFDAVASFRAHSGELEVAVHAVDEPANTEDLGDLGPFGRWDNAFVAASVTTPGDLSTRVQVTAAGAFHFQVIEIAERPMRPFAEIEEELTEAYVRAQVEEAAEAARKTFEEKLLELGKAKRAEQVAELEQERDAEIERRFDTWKSENQARLDDLRTKLESIRSARARAVYADEIDRLEKLLAAEAAERESITAAVTEEYDEKITAEARKAYGDVLADAASAAGFELRTLGPHLRSLSRQPRFQKRYPEDVRFLWSQDGIQGSPQRTGDEDDSLLEVGEATELLEDPTGKALYLAVVRDVKPATLADIPRRQLMARSQQFAGSRLTEALAQSLSVEALRLAYDYTDPEDAAKVQ